MSINSFTNTMGLITGKVVAVVFILVGLMGSLCALFPTIAAFDTISKAGESTSGLMGSGIFLGWLGLGYMLFFGYFGYLVGMIKPGKRSAVLWGGTIAYNMAFPLMMIFSAGSGTEGDLEANLLSFLWFGSLSAAAAIALFFDLERAKPTIPTAS